MPIYLVTKTTRVYSDEPLDRQGAIEAAESYGENIQYDVQTISNN